MAASVKNLSFKKNQVIFRQGDTADCVYKILYGSVNIYLNYQKENQKLLSTLDTDQYFGELALIGDTVRSATVVANSDTVKLAVYPKADFDRMAKEDPAPFREILSQMSTRLRSLTDKYMNVCRVISDYKAAADTNTDTSAELKQEINKYADIYSADK